MTPKVLILAVCLFAFSVRPLRGELNFTFRAGAATTDITPKRGVSLDGPISKNGPVTAVHDQLHARALVLDDENTRLAIVICDACMIGDEEARCYHTPAGGTAAQHDGCAESGWQAAVQYTPHYL